MSNMSCWTVDLVDSCIVSAWCWAFPLPSSRGGVCCFDIDFRRMSLVPTLWVRYCILLLLVDAMYVTELSYMS